jgi:hypothetical protein
MHAGSSLVQQLQPSDEGILGRLDQLANQAEDAAAEKLGKLGNDLYTGLDSFISVQQSDDSNDASSKGILDTVENIADRAEEYVEKAVDKLGTNISSLVLSPKQKNNKILCIN